eukprot:scaffold625419_cov32-Prasinocladus_malaysianus.AAC.1
MRPLFLKQGTKPRDPMFDSEQVDLYGFNQRSSHYFNKQSNSRRAFGERHAWALERQCMNLFSNLPAVTKRS